MQIISGTIVDAGQTSPPSGSYNVRYQDIVILDANNQRWYGRIGSKQGYQANAEISVTVEEKQGENGPYNYFRKHNPQYQGRPTPQQAQRGPSQPAQRPNAGGDKEMHIIRGNSLNAIMSATDVPLDMVGDYLAAGVQWIMTGTWSLKQKPATQEEVTGREPGEDIPY